MRFPFDPIVEICSANFAAYSYTATGRGATYRFGRRKVFADTFILASPLSKKFIPKSYGLRGSKHVLLGKPGVYLRRGIIRHTNLWV